MTHDLVKKDLLKSHPIFKELSDNEIKTIEFYTKEKTIPNHCVFIKQGEKGEDVYFIFSGSVRIFLTTEYGKEVTLALLGPGSVIGEMSFLDNEPRSACAETLQETRFLILSGNDFRKILHSNPDTAINLLKILSLRIRQADENIHDALSKNLYERTLKSLQAVSYYFKDQKIPLSQEDLSLILGATRPRVTEVLQQLKRDGKIDYTRKEIIIL